MSEQLGNSLSTPTTSLAAEISPSDTSLIVMSAVSLPGTGTFRVRIGDELIEVGAITGTDLSSLTRGSEGTTAASHLQGAGVTLVLTAAGLEAYVAQNGGGGSLPDGWTQEGNPAEVSANGGTLALGGGDTENDDDLVISSQQDVPGDGDRIFARGYGLDGETLTYAIYYQRNGIRSLLALYEVDGNGQPGQWYFDTGLEEHLVRLSLKGLDGQATNITNLWTGASQAQFTTDAFLSGAVLQFIVTAGYGESPATIAFVDPGAPSQPLSVSTVDQAVTVSLATDGGGEITSTAGDIQTLVNSDPDASAVMGANALQDGLVQALDTSALLGFDAQKAWGLLGNGAEYLQALPVTPDDGTVNTSARIQWYDDASGAPKLRLKERDSDGTLFERISAVLTSDATAFAGIEKQDLSSALTVADVVAALVALGLATS